MIGVIHKSAHHPVDATEVFIHSCHRHHTRVEVMINDGTLGTSR